jgi:thiol-disulfide isomerase/thioredoxin
MIEHLSKDTFKEKVFDFETNKDWKYEGKIPCIIDFYADWCGPCRTVAPILEELSEEFNGKLNIYKIDTQKQNRNLRPCLVFVVFQVYFLFLSRDSHKWLWELCRRIALKKLLKKCWVLSNRALNRFFTGTLALNFIVSSFYFS